MDQAVNNIPFYGLYGEPSKNPDLDFIHIEEIADRSRDRNWIIRTHRHSKLFQIVYLKRGEMEVNLDGINRYLKGESIITIPAGTAHGFKFQPNSEGNVLSFNISILFDSHSKDTIEGLHSISIAPNIFEYSSENFHLTQFREFVSILKQEFIHFNLGRTDALDALSKLVVLCVKRLQQQTQHYPEDGSDSMILHRFRLLLEAHYKDHWAVSDYAKKLHISLSTLNRLCRRCLGKGAKVILQERLLIESRRFLEYTQQSATEIAFALGFKDQAYFSRFFKKQMGITPGAYRSEKS